ncbi:META domain-containing protein [Hymenobacter terrenus]|uniref:META domain-containing protein n=1 Tax=Hymenobacter terrenus TaxID=1629124 RepID=UPI0006989143|nr:META domain-containing protein [Hymenobacter terrenus]
MAISCQPRPATEAANPAARSTRVAPDAQLRETRWVPRQIGSKVITVPANTREPFLLLRADGTAEGNGSCNRFRGNFFTETPGALQFSPLTSTRMACPTLATEEEFNRALAQSQTYRISGDTLRLFDATNAPLARLEAVYLR